VSSAVVQPYSASQMQARCRRVRDVHVAGSSSKTTNQLHDKWPAGYPQTTGTVFVDPVSMAGR
jgi:hypothetical protein